MATEYVAQRLASFGFRTECPSFECWDWTHGEVQLTVGGEAFEAFASPYSPGCQVSAPLAVASMLDELEALPASHRIVLLRGDLATQQLTPKNYPFYNSDEHRRIFYLLETQRPLAVIAATTRNPELVGAIYPFPLIEDGDFDIPSAYLTEEEGNRLLQHRAEPVSLAFQAQRIPSSGCNVVARRGARAARRLVLCAHIDAKETTVGALDNATGIATLLLLAELLQDYRGDLQVELVALNGEDDYSAAGQRRYLRDNRDKLSEIILAVNLDMAGYRQGRTAYSLYDCPGGIASSIRRAFSVHQELAEGQPWYQSDHMVFVQNQRPALAITSERLTQLLAEVAHTHEDRPELVDPDKLVHIALALRDVVLDLDGLVA